jgi:ATP-dependent Clp protease adaptor protein ClpS
MTQTKEEVAVSILDELVDMKDLVVYNDDVNTFDFVIAALIKICKHNPLQAEQCTMIIHYKGKCQVKRGQSKEMIDMCQSLLELGITAEVE